MTQPKLRKYKYLWRKCQERDVIIAAWLKLRKGKTTRRDVIAIEQNFEAEVLQMQLIMQNTRPGVVEDEAYRFTPPKHKARVVFEHGKLREIYAPSIREQWVHHVIIQVLAPIVTKYSYKYSCGSMPKRGSVYGKKKLEQLARKGFKYYAKCDIRHFFNSVKLDVVIKCLSELIADTWFLYLIRRIYMRFNKGLPLGFYPSQWLANFVLWRLDFKILSFRPKGYIRYMDDFVIVDNNKRRLHRLILEIKKHLGGLRLKLKRTYTVARFCYRRIGKYIDFMGFIFTRRKTLLRCKIMVRATRFAKKLHKLPSIAARQAMSMLSRCGWFKHTDTISIWSKYMRPMISIKALKKIVSNFMRRKSHENTMDTGINTYISCAI